MSANDTRQYLLQREHHCREMAERATEPSVRAIHEALARGYAERAEGAARAVQERPAA